MRAESRVGAVGVVGSGQTPDVLEGRAEGKGKDCENEAGISLLLTTLLSIEIFLEPSPGRPFTSLWAGRWTQEILQIFPFSASSENTGWQSSVFLLRLVMTTLWRLLALKRAQTQVDLPEDRWI